MTTTTTKMRALHACFSVNDGRRSLEAAACSPNARRESSSAWSPSLSVRSQSPSAAAAAAAGASLFACAPSSLQANGATTPPSSAKLAAAAAAYEPPLNPLAAIQKMSVAAQPSPALRPSIQLSKHQCGVCYKHFSSSSALQIHMRTHTG